MVKVLIMFRSFSVSTSLSFLLLSSTAWSAPSLSEHYQEELSRSLSPIHIVKHGEEEKIAVHYKKITGADALLQKGITGKGNKVIVIEGVFDSTHPDYVSNLTQSTTTMANLSEGLWMDYVVRPATTYLYGDHAAHVTGTVTGMAPKADIRVIDYMKEAFIGSNQEEITAEEALTRALNIASRTSGNIVNLSQALVHKDRHHTSPISAATRQAMIKVAQSGKIIVMAAGNEGVSLGDDVYTRSLVNLAHDPAMKKRLVLVGATSYVKLNERLAEFSDNPGKAGDFYISAPGDDIDGPSSYNRRKISSGTSMATPQVAGALALLMEAAPGLQPEAYLDLLYRSARKESLTKSYNFSANNYGHGILDVKAAYDLAQKEGKVIQPNPALKEKDAAVRQTPKVASSTFLEKAKSAATTLGHKVSTVAKTIGSAVKSYVSRFLGWGM